MSLTDRQYNIINYLLERDGFTTAAELSSVLKVSEKTIYRDFEDLISQHPEYENILIKTPGKGYKIDYYDYITFLSRANKEANIVNLSVEERRTFILMELLITSNKKATTNKLADFYFVSPTSINNDFTKISEILEENNLNLVRSNKGTYVDGYEIDIRKMLAELLNPYVLSDSLKRDTLTRKFTNNFYFEDFFDQSMIKAIDEILINIENRFNFVLDEPYYLNFYVYLLVLIARYKFGIVKEINNERANNKSENVDDDIYKIAEFVTSMLSDKLRVPLPECETKYIYGYLTSSRVVDTSNYTVDNKIQFRNKSDEYTKYTNELIQIVSKSTNTYLMNNDQLKKMLLPHVEFMFERIKHNVSIYNPLLGMIKLKFENLFNILNQAVEYLNNKYAIPMINEDEIAYLTLYFQGAIENIAEKRRILIVCSTGIGTSHFMENRILKVFPNWDIVDIVPSRNLQDCLKYNKSNNIDLIITTTSIETIEVPSVLVSVFFNDKDIENVINKLNDVSKIEKNGNYTSD